MTGLDRAPVDLRCLCAGDRIAAVILELVGRGDLGSLAGELAEPPAVRAAHTGPADRD
jgi:hypothetical protein